MTSLKFNYQGATGFNQSSTDMGVEGEEDADLDIDISLPDSNQDKMRGGYKLGPLAVSEIDDTISDFRGTGLEGIIHMMKSDGMNNIKQMLKVSSIFSWLDSIN